MDFQMKSQLVIFWLCLPLHSQTATSLRGQWCGEWHWLHDWNMSSHTIGGKVAANGKVFKAACTTLSASFHQYFTGVVASVSKHLCSIRTTFVVSFVYFESTWDESTLCCVMLAPMDCTISPTAHSSHLSCWQSFHNKRLWMHPWKKRGRSF